MPIFNGLTADFALRGITAIGRATVAALKLNLGAHVVARRLWIIAGVHPPLD